MKHFLLTLTVVTALGAGLLIALPMTAEAGKAYDNGDLKGTYYVFVTQVREERGLVSYCSGSGTVTFDGIGSGIVDTIDRCTVSGTTHDVLPHKYSVETDGTTLISTDPDNYGHCQIMDKGRMLVCDGTMAEPETLSFFAVAVKQ